MATIIDVAKKAGVSVTTVSRALNGYSDVNENTRKRITAIAQEMNYYPSAVARSLQGRKTNTIGFAPRLSKHQEAEPFFKEFIGVLSVACLKHDLSLLVTVADALDNSEEVYRELVGSGRVDGLVLTDITQQDERIALLRTLNVPFVAFGRTNDFSNLAYPFVDVDGSEGIKAVIDHLYAQNHRRIAFITDSFTTSCNFHRYVGYRKALREHSLIEDKQLLIENVQSQTAAKKALETLLELNEDARPTAIVATNDWLALLLMRTLEKLGVAVGREAGQIAVTGFDDLPFVSYMRPPLTTVRQPLQKVCDTMLALLVAQLKNNALEISEKAEPGQAWLGPEQVLIEPELIVRDSA